MKREWKLGIEAMMVAAALAWSGAALACGVDKDGKQVKADQSSETVAVKKEAIEATVAFKPAMPKPEEYGPAWSDTSRELDSEGSR